MEKSLKRIGFDSEKYLNQQKSAIFERVSKFRSKLYLEFGGKLIYDYHAARVLPGFDPNIKMRLLSELSSNADIILCIFAGDIERRKVRADFGITYDADWTNYIKLEAFFQGHLFEENYIRNDRDPLFSGITVGGQVWACGIALSIVY